jgi:hypothetical protein
MTLAGEDGTSKKSQVCKAVVIWPDARMTCWNEQQAPTVPPAAGIE